MAAPSAEPSEDASGSEAHSDASRLEEAPVEDLVQDLRRVLEQEEQKARRRKSRNRTWRRRTLKRGLAARQEADTTHIGGAIGSEEEPEPAPEEPPSDHSEGAQAAATALLPSGSYKVFLHNSEGQLIEVAPAESRAHGTETVSTLKEEVPVTPPLRRRNKSGASPAKTKKVWSPVKVSPAPESGLGLAFSSLLVESEEARNGRHSACAADLVPNIAGKSQCTCYSQARDNLRGSTSVSLHPPPGLGSCEGKDLAEVVLGTKAKRRSRRCKAFTCKQCGLPVIKADLPRLWCSFYLKMQHHKFELVPMIIGRKGCNTRGIADATGAKVRIRGQGSGHKESSTNREAPTPLMLVVATEADNHDGFIKAVSMTLNLLRNVETRWVEHCRKGNLMIRPGFTMGPLNEQLLDELQEVFGSELPPLGRQE